MAMPFRINVSMEVRQYQGKTVALAQDPQYMWLLVLLQFGSSRHLLLRHAFIELRHALIERPIAIEGGGA